VILVGGDFMNVDHTYRKFPSSLEAGEWFLNNPPENSFLLIKGSRSMKMETLLEYL